MKYKIRMKLKDLVRWIRFGEISGYIKAFDGGMASEIEYRGRFGKVLGYWAYGFYDPSLPYKGE